MSEHNNEPVIGLIVYKIHDIMKYPKVITNNYNQQVPFHNVKFIEQSGGKVFPIKQDLPDKEMKKMLDKVNGIFIPGSFDNIQDQKRNQTNATTQTFKIFDYVISQNKNTGKNIPILGICFGMQAMISQYCNKLKIDNNNCIDQFQVEKQSLELNATDYLNENYSKTMFTQLSKQKFDSIKKNKFTQNWHLYSILMNSYNTKLGAVKDSFHVLTTSTGHAMRTTNPTAKSDDEFISSIQHATLPWFGLQFHPEKPLFELYPSQQYPGIISNHDISLVSQAVSNYLIEQSRTLNDRTISESDLLNLSIQNQKYTFIKSLMTTVFVMK